MQVTLVARCAFASLRGSLTDVSQIVLSVAGCTLGVALDIFSAGAHGAALHTFSVPSAVVSMQVCQCCCSAAGCCNACLLLTDFAGIVRGHQGAHDIVVLELHPGSVIQKHVGGRLQQLRGFACLRSLRFIWRIAGSLEAHTSRAMGECKLPNEQMWRGIAC